MINIDKNYSKQLLATFVEKQAMRKRSFFIILLFFSYFTNAQTTTITAKVKYTTMGINDELEVTFLVEGGDITNFPRVPFEGFYLVDGPRTSRSEQRQNIGKRQVTTISTVLTYVVKPADTGMLTIDPVTVETTEGTKISSNKLTIHVVAGSAVNALNGSNFEPLSQGNMKFRMKIMESHDPYLIAFGPVYNYAKTLPDIVNDETLRSVINKAKSTAGAHTDITELGIYYWTNIPRIFFTVKDTAGVIAALRVLAVTDKNNIYTTTIENTRRYDTYRELMQLQNTINCYDNFNRLTEVLARNNKDTLQAKTIKVFWRFGFIQNRDVFEAALKKDKYDVGNKNDDKGQEQFKTKVYTITTSKETYLDHASLMSMAEQLLQHAQATMATYDKMIVNDN